MPILVSAMHPTPTAPYRLFRIDGLGAMLSSLILLVMMAFYGVAPTWKMLTLPLYVLLTTVTALGIGLWGAAMAVRFRDLRNAITYGIRVWMYVTPVAYSASLVPEKWLWLYRLNPLYWVIEGFRWALLGTGQPPQGLMWIPVTLVLLLLFSGAFVFRRTERTIVDWL